MSTRPEGLPLPPAPGEWTRALSVGRILTVTELTQRIRARLGADPSLQEAAVTGELADVRPHSSSGHLYFALKDRRSRLSCVMWRRQAERLEFVPRDGMQVVATGYVDIYPQGGAYQLYVHSLYPVGLGLLYARLQERYQRLAAEGLFDPARKRVPPAWPRAVGVVTSPDGAALRDIVAVVRRRSPSTPLYLYPAQVQGSGAAQAVVNGLERLAGWPGVDVIIVARGGGAADSLWTFNEESVVRAIAASPVPVISAVGHEIDVTLADLAADRRAPTPSAAAEMAVPDHAAARQVLRQLEHRLVQAAVRRLQRARQELERLTRQRVLTRPALWLSAYRQQVDELSARARSAVRERIQRQKLVVVDLSARLSASSPLALLQRGYAVVEDPETGRPLRRAGQARQGQAVRVRMEGGRLDCRVEGVNLDDRPGAREPSGTRREPLLRTGPQAP